MAKIIIVDDDERLTGAIAEYLQACGHKTATARDGEEFAFMLQGGLPDLVLLDMQFRGGGGPAAMRHLPPAMPVVVMSGMPAKQQESWFGGRPKTRYMVKPMKLDELKAVIDEMLSGGAPKP